MPCVICLGNKRKKNHFASRNQTGSVFFISVHPRKTRTAAVGQRARSQVHGWNVIEAHIEGVDGGRFPEVQPGTRKEMYSTEEWGDSVWGTGDRGQGVASLINIQMSLRGHKGTIEQICHQIVRLLPHPPLTFIKIFHCLFYQRNIWYISQIKVKIII